jgi:hypothetical protein
LTATFRYALIAFVIAFGSARVGQGCIVPTSGVKDRTRLDSYFDPFGNLTVVQRATVELILLLDTAAGSAREAAELSKSLCLATGLDGSRVARANAGGRLGGPRQTATTQDSAMDCARRGTWPGVRT